MKRNIKLLLRTIAMHAKKDKVVSRVYGLAGTALEGEHETVYKISLTISPEAMQDIKDTLNEIPHDVF